MGVAVVGLFFFSPAKQPQMSKGAQSPELPFIAGLSLALPIDTTTLFKKRQGREKKKEGRSTLPCTEKIQWRSTEETSTLFFFFLCNF